MQWPSETIAAQLASNWFSHPAVSVQPIAATAAASKGAALTMTKAYNRARLAVRVAWSCKSLIWKGSYVTDEAWAHTVRDTAHTMKNAPLAFLFFAKSENQSALL